MLHTLPREWNKLGDTALAALAKDANPGLVTMATAEQDRRRDDKAELAKRFAPWRAEQKATQDAADAARKAERDAAEQARRDETEATLRRRFLAVGGSEAEWAAEKDEVLAEHRRRSVMAGETTDDRARALNSQRYG